MFGGDHLQDEVDRKLQAKIAHKRRIDEERLARLRVGMKGVDIASLDAQVKEKQMKKGNDKDLEKMMTEQALEIERRLAEAEQEENAIKKYAKDQLIASWEQAKLDKEQRNMASKNDPDYKPEIAGPASAMFFAGADVDYEEINVKKKNQMKCWIEDQMAQKTASKATSNAGDADYLAMLAAINEVCVEAENEEKELAKYVNRSVKDHNAELAAMAKERRMKEKEESMKNGFGYNQLLQEDKAYAFDSNGKLMRKDMFKGFTKEQQNAFMKENQALIDAKMAAKEDISDVDYNYMLIQMAQMKALERAEFEESEFRKHNNEEYMRYLDEQISTNKNQRREEKDYYGAGNQGDGFFDKFGTSAR